jgi:hypothetical protein
MHWEMRLPLPCALDVVDLRRAINLLPHWRILTGFDLQRYVLQKFMYRLEHPVSVGASCRKAGCQSLMPSVSNLL